MKKIFILAISVLAVAILLIVPATPAVAATLFQGEITSPVDMKEPIVYQITKPVVPDGIWPGDSFTWKYQVNNIGPRDYLVSPRVEWSISPKGEIWIDYSGSIAGKKFNPWEGILVSRGSSVSFTITLLIREDSPVAKGLQFKPFLDRIGPPQPQQGKG